MSTSPVEDQSVQECKSIHHYGGGLLCLQTAQEQDAFARGRIENAADLIEVCAASIKADNAPVHSVLMQVYSMLHEAKDALPTPLNK